MQSTGFLKPRIVDVQNISPLHAKVTMEPFERGYGHTLGQRAAPCPALVDARLRADRGQDLGRAARVLDARRRAGGRGRTSCSTSKGVVLKLHNRDDALLALKKEGEGVVTAGRHRGLPRCRDRQSRSRHRASRRGRQDRHAAEGRTR